MKKSLTVLSKILSLLLALGLVFSCEKAEEIRKNPYDDTSTTDLKVSYSYNADKVYINWELSNSSDIDGYRVYDALGNNDFFLEKEVNSCTLTRIPYQKAVTVNIEVIKGGEVISKTQLSVKTDGLDNEIKSTLIPDNSGVTGGDGMYSIALPDGRTLFIFQDSYVGRVTNGQRSASDHMFRNTFSIYDNGQMTAVYGPNNKSACIPPDSPNEWPYWYWPMDGFVVDNELFLFHMMMYQAEAGQWGFRFHSSRMTKYSLPDLKLIGDYAIPFTGSDDTHYGAAALNDDGTLYIYAQVDIENSLNTVSKAIVARSTRENITNKWEYYTGSGWSDDSNDAAYMSGLDGVQISSQFNVFKLRDKYVLLSQEKSFNAGTIYTFVSSTPYGPWTNKKLIFTVPQENSNWFSYNAMAHPEFTRDDMILISYNMNTSVDGEHVSDVECYRPRFFWVPINDIINK